MVSGERMPLRIERLNRRRWQWRQFLRRHSIHPAEAIALAVCAGCLAALMLPR